MNMAYGYVTGFFCTMDSRPLVSSQLRVHDEPDEDIPSKIICPKGSSNHWKFKWDIQMYEVQMKRVQSVASSTVNKISSKTNYLLLHSNEESCARYHLLHLWDRLLKELLGTPRERLGSCRPQMAEPRTTWNIVQTVNGKDRQIRTMQLSNIKRRNIVAPDDDGMNR